MLEVQVANPVNQHAPLVLASCVEWRELLTQAPDSLISIGLKRIHLSVGRRLYLEPQCFMGPADVKSLNLHVELPGSTIVQQCGR